MAGDELDLSEFEEFSSTAKERARKKGADPRVGSGGGGGDGDGGGGPRRWPWLLAGIVLGVLGAVFGPELAAPYLPQVLRPGTEEVSGPVVGKRVGNDRVLLTVDTEQGALLATFRQRVPEIDLLVEEGDTVTLGIPAYAPLVEDPALAAVKKGPGAPGRVTPAPPAESGPAAGPELDTTPGEEASGTEAPAGDASPEDAPPSTGTDSPGA